MKYFRISKETGEREEITKAKALNILLGAFIDNDITRDMLETPNTINCIFSIIEVQEDEK